MKPSESPLDFKIVLTSFNSGDVSVMQSLLESERIPFHFQNEMGNRHQIGAGPARLFVREDYLDQAKELLKDFIEGPSTTPGK